MGMLRVVIPEWARIGGDEKYRFRRCCTRSADQRWKEAHEARVKL